MPINRKWHEGHRMPKNPTEEERIAWHRGHAKACGCRPIPKNLVGRIKARGKDKE